MHHVVCLVDMGFGHFLLEFAVFVASDCYCFFNKTSGRKFNTHTYHEVKKVLFRKMPNLEMCWPDTSG